VHVTAPRVRIVVVHLDGWKWTSACLEAVRKLAYDPFAAIVVDNGSTDGSGERVAAAFAEIEVIRSERNLGFAAGANIGMRAALADGAEYVWLLNNDARPEPQALAALVESAERDDRIGIVGSILEEPDGQVWGGGRLSRLARTRPARSAGKIDYVSGASMLLRRGLLEEVGLFDESFFFYYEDAELCLRAHARGWRLAVAPGSSVAHALGATMGSSFAGRPVAADLLQAESGGLLLGRRSGKLAYPLGAVRIAGIAAQRLGRGHPHRAVEVSAALLRGIARGKRLGKPSP
jgi:GT2 family glycosyltransferase